MQPQQTTAKILDFTAFRQQRQPGRLQPQSDSAPMYVWYPVWVLLPTPANIPQPPQP